MFVLVSSFDLLQAGGSTVFRVRAADVLVESGFRARVVIEHRASLDAAARTNEFGCVVRRVRWLTGCTHPFEECRLVGPEAGEFRQRAALRSLERAHHGITRKGMPQ
ncbi:hypothetical protein [Burkholderia vietnamiensis]|uniref:hypothetical protein n=1 Tax=Burkholderia vietnamiensis TaxID=60552 RepID=UPI001CF4A878|nr:hypothetical protein [Burkholderia vietnamiensis]MCA8195458.1 hypothetical protein [Burkholderia vietnamiensis]